MCACVCVFVCVYTHILLVDIYIDRLYTWLSWGDQKPCSAYHEKIYLMCCRNFFPQVFSPPKMSEMGQGQKTCSAGKKTCSAGKQICSAGKKNLFCTSWDPRHAHVTHINASCHAYACIVSHVWLVHVTRMNAIGHVTNMNASCLAYESVMSHI